MNPAQLLKRTAVRMPLAPALMVGAEVVATYSEFDRLAAEIGASLQSRGIGKGDRVGVFMPNSVTYLLVLYGIWYAGAAAIPINAKLHRKEAEWIIGNAAASLVFVDDTHAADLAGLLPGGPEVVSVNATDFTLMRHAVPMTEPVSMGSDDLLWLFYTSGTTGRPKGVMITCGMITSMAHSYLIDVDEVRAEDAILYAAPMSHGAGLYNFMHVVAGARHVVPPSGGFDPTEILEIGKALGAVSMFAAPTMVRRLVDVAKKTGETGDGIKTIVYAGGPMYEADILEAVEVMGPRFVQIYGQGECPMGITALSRDDVAGRRHPEWRARLNSVGVAQSGIELRVVAPDGADVAAGEIGEIAVRGATVMPGYWDNPSATDAALQDGWLLTGDLGRLDDAGYLTLQDRSKDMIISGGSNIYPREVEEVLLAHTDVLEAAVVGRPHPEWGEEVVAFVALRAGTTITVQDLDQLCLDRIARFKRPKEYVFVDSLPKNNYGKVLKTDLRARLRGGD